MLSGKKIQARNRESLRLMEMLQTPRPMKIRPSSHKEEFHKQIEDYLIQEHPQKTRNPGKPKIAGEESAKHERRRTNDEPSESNLPLARTNAGECSQNPN